MLGPGWLLRKRPTRTAAGRAGLWGCPRCPGGPHAPSTLLAPRGPPCAPAQPCPGAVPIAGALAPPAGCGENHVCSAVPALPRTRPARQTSHLPPQGRVRAPEAAQATAARPRALQRALQGPWHPLHKAGATPQAWGARGIRKRLHPGCLRAACSSAPGRACVCTAAQCLASVEGGDAARSRGRQAALGGFGEPPSTHPSCSVTRRS